jgi:GntR family transcriptional regulator
MIQYPPTKINPNSSEPLYDQIKQSILDFIEKNDLSSGDLLPSERELCERFTVSRLTIRKAIDELIRLGVVFRRPGKGTYISQPKLQQRLLVVTSFTEAITKEGHTPGARLLEMEILQGSKKVCDLMELPEGSALLRTKRLRFVDEIPFSIQTNYLRYDLLPGIELEIEKASLYPLIETRYNIKLVKTKAMLEAIVADYACAALLWVKPGTPLFLMSGAVRDSQDRVIEYFKATYRGDRMRFITESQ